MNGLTGEFRWSVPSGGFRIQVGRYQKPQARVSRGGLSYIAFEGPIENELQYFDGTSDYLVPNLPEGDFLPSGRAADDSLDKVLPFAMSGSAARDYHPLSDFPALFREFASMENSMEAVLAFANQWGALGSEGTCEIDLIDDDGYVQPSRGRPVWGEAVVVWGEEWKKMHDAVVLWESVRANKTDSWEKSFSIEGDTVYCDWGTGWVSAPEFHPERFQQIQQFGLPRAARFAVQDIVNEGLRARVHDQLQWDDAAEDLRMRVIPINLIGALWLQLANAIESNRDYDQCAECSGWFEIAPGSGRPDKRFCSDACRMRAYRKRKTAKQAKNSAVR